MESAPLNEQQTGEFCRRRSVFPEQLAAWREACTGANGLRPGLACSADDRKPARRNAELERALRRMEKALAETALVRDACAAGARLEAACAVLGLSNRTLQRWREHGAAKPDGRLAAGRTRTPANKLSPEERQRIVATANSAEFASLPPSQIVPRLADQGESLASESSVYRILREVGQLARRGFGLGPGAAAGRPPGLPTAPTNCGAGTSPTWPARWPGGFSTST